MANVAQSRPSGPQVYQPAEALALFHYLCYAYRKGQFTFRQFNEALKVLRFLDINGAMWTVGAGSGKWYRRQDPKWLRGEPASRLVISVEMLWYDFLQKSRESSGCGKCGAQLPASSRFCLNCGAVVAKEAKTAIAETSKTLYCRQCGQIITAGAKFCNTCGARRQ
jgi:RNA polymerase subunit RPABC4/transcription elongation factor Spt4